MKIEKYDYMILLDDDARGKVKAFIKNCGLDYLKKEFDVEDVVAVIGEKKAKEFNLYQNIKKMKTFKMPTKDNFPKETAENILSFIDARDKKILLLCDWEWIVDTSGGTLEDSLKKVVDAFDLAQSGECKYKKIMMIFYTTVLEKNVKIPNQIGEININQKTILDWRWEDITSSVFRVKKLLSDSMMNKKSN